MSLFSVIIPTRNRPALFERALGSVLQQTCKDVEVIAVNDGSADNHLHAYSTVARSAPRHVKFLALPARPNGHGPSYAINTGALAATSPFLCFLDDDDSWTDCNHLSRIRDDIQGSGDCADLYMSNQAAFANGVIKPGPAWIEGLSDVLSREGGEKLASGLYKVTVSNLLKCGSFCHLNTLIVRRNLFLEVSGMDETIRWEGDHDLYLRLIDHARTIKYAPFTVSRHNIPDPKKSENETTSFSELLRRLSQLRVLDKAAVLSGNPAIRRHARVHRTWALQRIASTLSESGANRDALYYAFSALASKPSIGWTARTLYWAALSLLKR